MIYPKSMCILLTFATNGIFVKGTDPFERASSHPECLKVREMKNCSAKLTSIYKNVSRSFNNGSEADSAFYLFTRHNHIHPEDLQLCGGRLPSNTAFNSNHDTKIVVHGYIDGVCLTTWMREIKDQLLERGNYNVILVDWTWGNGYDFSDAMQNLRIVAHQLVILIRHIKRQTCTGRKKFHLIGHSLGAQMVGFVGERTGIGRITGLDPCGPGYIDASKKERLDQSDADEVDCIHTNAGSCQPQLGDIMPMCDADFFVNGGTEQHSCIPYAAISFLKGDIRIASMAMFSNPCSHCQAVQYYKVSINPDEQFVGVMCENYDDFRSGKCNFCGHDGSRCAVMGMDYDKHPRKTNKSSPTKYFLDTSLMCPYVDNKKIRLQGYKTQLHRPS